MNPRPATVHDLPLSGIESVTFYKRDEITTDLICCEIEALGQIWFYHEEGPDWDGLIRRLESLPGFRKDWYGAVVLPAFERCVTVAYRRSHERVGERLGYGAASERLYTLIERWGIEGERRDLLIEALKTVCAYVAGGDGRVGIQEDGALFQIFWQDVRHEVDFDLLRQLQENCDVTLETAFRVIEDMARDKARAAGDEAPRAELAGLVLALCDTVIAADRDHPAELERLSKVRGRLRA